MSGVRCTEITVRTREMTRKYFGTDGIRGTVGHSPITPDFVLRLGYAAGRVLVRHREHASGVRPAVLIGKDTRTSGYMLESALEAGLSAAGVDIYLVGPMPTPAVAYLTRALRLQAGIVISASHNPFHDNGIKFFSGYGNKLPDAVEIEIEDALDWPLTCVEAAHLGKARRIDDAAGRYIEFCKSTFPNDLDLHGLKLVVDCAHGAAYHIAPHVFHELGAEVITIGAQPNGLNINQGVGATAPAALAQAVISHQADLGLALDGDADRLVMVDATGRTFDGDELLYVILKSRLEAGPIPGVVGTLMSNMALELAVRERGVEFVRAKVGDRYVLENLLERGWTLGGENSGHLLCLDKHTTGDGIVSALQVLASLRRSQQTLRDYLGGLTLFPQVLVNVPLLAGSKWNEIPGLSHAVSEAELALAGQGRVLLRPSGTEPLLRVMVEGRNQALVESLAHSLADRVRKFSLAG